jgi:hypothetical protein
MDTFECNQCDSNLFIDLKMFSDDGDKLRPDSRRVQCCNCRAIYCKNAYGWFQELSTPPKGYLRYV